MNPSAVGSKTIRMLGLERLVVVFPAILESAVVTVDDVLITVHRAVQASAMERIWHEIWLEKATGVESIDPSSLPNIHTTTPSWPIRI
jgi:hypothetical protein